MMNELISLKTWQKYFLLIFSFLIVAFGQPVWSGWIGLLAAVGGFACFWRVLLDISNAKERFCMAMGWYAGVQVVQLSWFLSSFFLYLRSHVILRMVNGSSMGIPCDMD